MALPKMGRPDDTVPAGNLAAVAGNQFHTDIARNLT